MYALQGGKKHGILPLLSSGCSTANGAGIGKVGDPMMCLDTNGTAAIAFDTTQITHPENRSQPAPGRPCHPLAAAGHAPAIAFTLEATASESRGAGTPIGMLVAHSAPRRLTPRECERLQGLPDDWTLIAWRGKPAADGPRYRAIGNSMAVPVMRWILDRLRAAAAIGGGVSPSTMVARQATGSISRRVAI